MSIIRERPFWERKRGGGPITEWLESRKRLESKFAKRRAQLRRPDLHVKDASAVVVRARARVD